MKHLKITFLALIAILIATACSNSQNDKEYKILVQLQGLGEGNQLIMQERTENGFQPTDTANFNADGFEFKGTVEQPSLAYITSTSFRGAIPVFLEAGNIQITGSIDSLSKVKVTGSSSHDFFTQTNQKLADFDKIWQDFYFGPYRAMSKEDQDLNEGKVNMLYDSAQNLKTHYLETELLKNGDQPATPVLALNYIDQMNVDASQAIYDNLTPEISEMDEAKQLANRLTILKRTSIGQPLIDFTMNDTLGNPVTLSEYAAGKYVLVDFWAAWCAPCRGENPNVVANYKKYHDKGFTVFGVSFDKKKEDWLKAIKDDGLLWEQVSDIQGWNNAAGKLYGIQSIPQNLLLDPSGIIIGKNLRGPALGDKLEELLGK